MEDFARLAIDCSLKLGAEFADIRLERAIGTSITIMDGKTKTMSAQNETGFGLRAFVGGGWGFATSSSISSPSIRKAAESAVKMAKAAQAKAKIRFEIRGSRAVKAKEIYRCTERPSDVTVEEKVSFASSLDRSMKALDSRISSSNARYDDLEVDRVVANSLGSLVETGERWTGATCSAWAMSEGIVQHGHASVGSVGGYELMRTEPALKLGVDAGSQALRLLDSKSAPAGKFMCVLDNKMTGILAHEAFGHACEADAILASSSVLEGKVGKKVAHESISMYDDPTIKNTFGYFSIDWEGVRAKKHVLIERGVLKGFMHNLETSSRMGESSNGSARSQGYSSPPIIRMSNTYIGPGDMKKDELIGEVKHGLLIQGSQYGYVEPAKGQFMFKCDEAYEITKGEIGQRYRDASLSGMILEVLHNIQGVANDFVLCDPGLCGKSGQDARVTDGGPHICVSDIVVGGLS
jgi:TldD protein